MKEILLTPIIAGLMLIPNLEAIAQEKPTIIIASGEMIEAKGKDKNTIITAASGTKEPVLLDKLVSTYNDNEQIDYTVITSDNIIRTKDRAKAINTQNADAYIEFHYLGVDKKTREQSTNISALRGYAIHCPRGDKESLELAQYIGVGLRNHGLSPTKFYRKHDPKMPYAQGNFEIGEHSIPNELLGIYERTNSYQGENLRIKHLEDIAIPALKVDVGFVDTKKGEEKMLSKDFQQKFKAGIEEGISLWQKRGE